MTPQANTYTVTIADAHAHTVAQAGVVASGKLDAALSVVQQAQDSPAQFAGFTATDTWTISVTQP